MFARVATFNITDRTAVDEMGERIRGAVTPIVESLRGWQGATQLLDREGGQMLVMQYFDSRENMDAAEATFETLPQRLPDDVKDVVRRVASGRQSVQRFEVLAETRTG